MKARKILEYIENKYPPEYSCDWDNTGIEIGDLEQNIEKILISLDITEQVLQEAQELNCNMIVVHHPLIFKEINGINRDTKTGKLIFEAIKNNIFIYSLHSNLDIAPGGLNDYMADILGIEDLSPLQITKKKKYYKLVVYIPESHFEQVKSTILENGAGKSNKYSHCSFRVSGTGTFQPLSGSQPYTGKKNEIGETKEYRFETIVPEQNLEQVKNKMLAVHPYEEVAYDVLSLENKFQERGLGRIGNMNQGMKLIDFVKNIKEVLKTDKIQYTGARDKNIKKVAICTGSGGDLIADVVAAGVDLYLTGEIKYHQAQYAEEHDIAVVRAGHYHTEKKVKNLLQKELVNIVNNNNLDLKIAISRENTNPWLIF